MKSLTGALAAVVVTAGTLVAAAPAQADPGDIAVSIIGISDTEIHVAICINAIDALPASVAFDYNVSSGGGSIVSGRIADDDPNAVVLLARGCPREFTSFAVVALSPAKAHTISVTATLTPKLVVDSDEVESTIETDPDRPVRSESVTVSATTTGSSTAGGGASVPVTDDPDAGSSPSTTLTVVLPSDAGPSVIVIAEPSQFGPDQLASLSPIQVASIDPASFGMLAPEVFAALRPIQAAELTVAQASSIRPARAAELKAATVAALPPNILASMRPAAIKFLSPAAVKAMTVAQLKALTPRQVDALRPKQLATLTAAEKRLLRNR